jgi:dTDP-4-dehydrorhamnose 3,5-epimerase
MEGVRLIENQRVEDERGNFLKFYSHERGQLEAPLQLHESFISQSFMGVIRGFHLQTGRSANHRIIQVVVGKVFDVLLDLRPDSETFGTFEIHELSDSNSLTLIVPPGVAHGFQAIENSTMLYLTSSTWDPKRDKGVNPLQSGFPWPMPATYVSERDLELPNLQEFVEQKLFFDD